MKKIALFILLLLPLLTSCGKTETVVVDETIFVPVYPPFELVCDEPPKLPIMMTGGNVAEFILRSEASGNDCRTELARAKHWVDEKKAVSSD